MLFAGGSKSGPVFPIEFFRYIVYYYLIDMQQGENLLLFFYLPAILPDLLFSFGPVVSELVTCGSKKEGTEKNKLSNVWLNNSPCRLNCFVERRRTRETQDDPGVEIE